MLRAKKWMGLVSLLLVLSLSVIGCGSSNSSNGSSNGSSNSSNQGTASSQDNKTSAKTQEFKVGFVYNTPVGGSQWILSHDLGRQALEKKFSNVKTSYVENVAGGADAERVFTQMAQEGYKVIVAASFDYGDAIQAVAKQYPNVVFLHSSGLKTAPNVSVFNARMEQVKYLAGMVAGMMTKSNIIGYVGGHPIPDSVRQVDGFTLGVKSVNPQATVKALWTNQWYDPAADKQATNSLIDQGADIISEDVDSPAPQQAAEARKVFCIGTSTDMRQYAPNYNLTSTVWNWGAYYANQVQQVMDGTWKSTNWVGTLKDNVMGLAPFSDKVPDNVKQAVAAKEQQFKDGTFNVFQGPVKDNHGNLKVPAGQVLSDSDSASINWYVEGIQGELPKQ